VQLVGSYYAVINPDLTPMSDGC